MLHGEVAAYLLKKHDEPSTRRQDIIHPSEMAKADWCHKQTYFRLSNTPPTNSGATKFSFQLENIFEEGNEIHAKWQAWLTEMELLWGRWYCPKCHMFWVGTAHENDHWNHARVEYKEVPLDNGLIAGHADGAIPSKNALVEIKSVGLGTLRFEEPSLLRENHVETTNGKKIYDIDAIWANMHRPFSSHLRQGNIYLWLCQQMGLPYDRMVFLYEFKPNQASREFVVKYSPTIMDPLLDRVNDVEYALRSGKPPVQPPHTSPTAPVCKSCAFYDLCWRNDAEPSSTEDTQRHLTDGNGVPAGEAGIGEAESLPAVQTDRANTRPAGRVDRTRRRKSDAVVQHDDSVVHLSVGSGFDSGSGRKVRRSNPRQDQSPFDADAEGKDGISN